ncbi:MAG: hypothetical protein RRB22_01225 [Gammaproteobacteria bacterium]|nr:hypothetical protein [Gammaproteobacteria bacterium]
MIDWNTVGVVVAIAGSVAGLLKYVFYLLDKHKESIDERFSEHHNKIEKNSTDIRTNEKKINDTRDEIHKDYVREDTYRNDLQNMTKVASDNFKAMFKKMDAVAKDLNQLIGAHNGKVKSDIERQTNENEQR